MAVCVSETTYLDSAPKHALGIVIRACEEGDQDYSVAVYAPVALRRVVYGRLVDVVLVVVTLVPRTVPHDYPSTKQQGIDIIGEHGIDEPFLVHPRELRLGLGWRRPVRKLKRVEHRTELDLNYMDAGVDSCIALDLGTICTIEDKDGRDGQRQETCKPEKERAQCWVLASFGFAGMVHPERRVDAESQALFLGEACLPLFPGQVGERAVDAGRRKLLP